MENKKTLKLVAGACFAAMALWQIFLVLGCHWGMATLVIFVADVLIAVALFSSKSILSNIGAGIGVIYYLINFIRIFSRNGITNFAAFRQYIAAVGIPTALLLAVYYLILATTKNNTRSAKTMGLIAAIVSLVNLVFYYIIHNLSVISLLESLLLAVGAYFLGATYCQIKGTSSAVPTTTNTAATIGSSDQIEKLTKLKGLLDSGVITQEEFNAKKKQILGL